MTHWNFMWRGKEDLWCVRARDFVNMCSFTSKGVCQHRHLSIPLCLILPWETCISISHILHSWEYKREWRVVSSFPAAPALQLHRAQMLQSQRWCTHVLVDVWYSFVNVSYVTESSINRVSMHSFIILTVDLHFPPNLLERLSGITELSFYCLARIQPGCLSHMNSNCMELP